MIIKKKINKEVIKHSSSIQITNRINLIERKSWNILLANAFEELPTKDIYSIRVKDLAQMLEFDSKNEEHLKEALRKLNTVQIEWNILDKDKKKEWGVTTLLSEVKFKDGVCIYGFSSTLRERLYNPEMYAKISLLTQNKIKSKHTLALYELLLDYLNNKLNYGETPLMSIKKFRELMGVKSFEYNAFKDLNSKIIKPAIKEINSVTNLSVKLNFEKEGRKVIGIKFFIKKSGDDDLINLEQLSLLENVPKKENNINLKSQKIKDFCKENKVNQDILSITIAKHGEEYIEFIIHNCLIAKNIKSVSGFFVSSLKNRTFLEGYELIKEGRKEVEKQRLKKLEEKNKEKILAIYNKEEGQYLKQFFQEHEELFLNLLEKNSKNNSFIKELVLRTENNPQKLINNQLIIQAFYNDVRNHNDYHFPIFDDWKKDPSNKEKILN